MKNCVILVVTIVLVMCMIVGCGNVALGPGNYSFKKIHVDTHNYSGCLTIKNWHENDTGIEVRTEEYGSMYLSEGTYVLIEDECPFCDD